MKRFTCHFSLFALALFMATVASAQTTGPSPQFTADVWPAGKMPGTAATQPEAPHPAKDEFHRITNISHPTLLFFPAPKKDAPAPAMIVCPGGGYNYVLVDKEGTEIAAWLNSLGISAAVLKYRTPHNRDGAFQDTQRALSLARANAGKWNIDPHRLGIIGFSAGGNLAAKASNLFDSRSYAVMDAVDQQSCRPDFAILVYPAYLERDGQLAGDLNLKANIPPTLIVHNEDDKTFVPGTKLYHALLDKAGHPNELLMYPTGGHGYGLHCTKDAKAWPHDALPWLKKLGIISVSKTPATHPATP
jgi:acetyl esterase/lipase